MIGVRDRERVRCDEGSMIATSTEAGGSRPRVTVQCRVAGGPWFVGLGGLHVPEIELGPYENPAIAREDATKLRQFLDSLFPTPALTRAAYDRTGSATVPEPQFDGLSDAARNDRS